jgi:hypothetical protein
MTIRQCVKYRNDLRGTLTFDIKVKQLFFKYYLFGIWVHDRKACVAYDNDFRGTLTFDLKVK